MILTHLVLFSFFNGAGGSVTPPVTPVVVSVGGGGKPKRRRIIIDDVIYEGTDEQIEAHLHWLLEQREVPPKPRKRKKPAPAVVVLKTAPVEFELAPISIDMTRYERFLTASQAQNDRFLETLLTRMMRRYLEDEDDIEVLLLH